MTAKPRLPSRFKRLTLTGPDGGQQRQFTTSATLTPALARWSLRQVYGSEFGEAERDGVRFVFAKPSQARLVDWAA